MGATPPPAILVKPHDMAEAVRAATVMGPYTGTEIGGRAVGHDIDALAKTRESIGREREELTAEEKALALEKTRLAALVDARQQSLASAQDALGSQQQRAAELAKQATSLKDLLARLDSEDAARKAAATAAHAAEEAVATEIEARAEATRGGDPARLRPEIAFGDSGTGGVACGRHDLEEFRLARRPGGDRTRTVFWRRPPGRSSPRPSDGSVLFSDATGPMGNS